MSEPLDSGQVIPPDERVLRAHLEAGPFQLGTACGRWRLIRIAWPYVWIAVAAAPRENAPAEYSFRFDCTQYPQAAPTAAPWDPMHDRALPADDWPGGTGRVADAFNPGWNAAAIYLPCDRIALQGHDGWRTQHPHLLWTAAKDITHYLKILDDYLHSPHYTGLRCSRS